MDTISEFVAEAERKSTAWAKDSYEEMFAFHYEIDPSPQEGDFLVNESMAIQQFQTPVDARQLPV